MNTSASINTLQAHFLSLLPRIELHARICFRHVRCPGQKEDAIAEVVAVAWKWFLRATAKGKDVSQFASVLASYAARHVRSGRKLAGQDRARDVLSSVAQQRQGFTVGKLAGVSTLTSNPLNEALVDNTQTPPGEQAAFRIDFPTWLAALGGRNRRIAEDMALGERTQDLAARHGTSPGRISQLRREFHQDWQRFTGEAAHS
jgi:hypothetical protein